LLSVTCAACTLVLAWFLSRRVIPTFRPGWLVATLALHPLLIWAAVEIRVYALVAALSAGLLLLFYHGFMYDDAPRAVRIAYAVLAVAALYTQYYLGFSLVANAAALFVTKRWRPLRDYLLLMIPVGLALGPVVVARPAWHLPTECGSEPLVNALVRMLRIV